MLPSNYTRVAIKLSSCAAVPGARPSTWTTPAKRMLSLASRLPRPASSAIMIGLTPAYFSGRDSSWTGSAAAQAAPAAPAATSQPYPHRLASRQEVWLAQRYLLLCRHRSEFLAGSDLWSSACVMHRTPKLVAELGQAGGEAVQSCPMPGASVEDRYLCKASVVATRGACLTSLCFNPHVWASRLLSINVPPCPHLSNFY